MTIRPLAHRLGGVFEAVNSFWFKVLSIGKEAPGLLLDMKNCVDLIALAVLLIERSADDQASDFARTCVVVNQTRLGVSKTELVKLHFGLTCSDFVELGVSHDSTSWIVVDVTITAEDLNGIQSDLRMKK